MIYLIGYMGVGKSLIAQELSKRLNIPFIDTDKKIEEQEGEKIKNIFKTKGEDYFRKLENKILQQSNSHQIVACGGGLPIYNNNMKYIINHGVSIYLEASSNFLYSRLRQEKDKRPLISKISEDELIIFIKKQLNRREKFYKTATHTINVENKTVEEILREVDSLI